MAYPSCDRSSTRWPSAVAVCVPVRDERRRLPALMRALAEQHGVTDGFWLCLLFDGPQLESQSVVQRLARDAGLRLLVRTIERTPQPNAGRARRAAMLLGLEAVGQDDRALLLTTDADSVPAPDWVAANAAALAKVHVVAGYIRRRRVERGEKQARLERYRERLYRLQRTIDVIEYDPAPSHPSVGGASLGFRAPVYRALDGFSACPCHEDVGIGSAARRAGYRLCHDRTVRVTTSSRLRGRAVGGMADTLNNSKHSTALAHVEHPDEAVARYRRAAMARKAFSQRPRESALYRLAMSLALPLAVVQAHAARARSADAFTLAVVPETPSAHEVGLAEAERRLARLESHYYRRQMESFDVPA